MCVEITPVLQSFGARGKFAFERSEGFLQSTDQGLEGVELHRALKRKRQRMVRGQDTSVLHYIPPTSDHCRRNVRHSSRVLMINFRHGLIR